MIEAGHPFVVRDVHTTDTVDEELRQICLQMQVISYIDVLIIKHGKAVGVLCLVQSTPRDWSDLEVELATETAERTWGAVERMKAEKALREAKEYAESIVETLHEPLLVLHPDLRVKSANQAFYDHFQVNRAETEGRLIYHFGNKQWNIPELRTLLEDVLPDSQVFNDYEVTHDFEDIGKRVMLVNARRLDHVQLILLGIRDITERKWAEEAVQTSLEAVAQANEQLEQRVQERTAELSSALEELAIANTVRRELLHRLVNAQEEERGHVSRELHDNTGQLITALLLGLANLPGVLPAPLPAPAAEMLTKMRQIADELGTEAHRLSVNLRPTALDDMGLVASVKNYLEQWSTWSGLSVDYQTVGFREESNGVHGENGDRLPREVESAAYRIVQEALTNILRHASPNRPAPHAGPTGTETAAKSADSVSVLLQRTNRHLMAIVEDNGPGFDVAAAMSLPADRRRLGLFGMKERAELVGGSLEIESRPGAGTTIFFRAPLQPPDTPPPPTE